MRYVFVLFIAFWSATAQPATADTPAGPIKPANGGLIDLAFERDPELKPPRAEVYFPPRLAALWLAGLDRPEVDERRQAAEAFAQASTLGMKGLDPAVAKLSNLVTDDPSVIVRVTCAEALDTIDDSAAAAALVELLDTRNPDLVLPADRALARWKAQPALARWRERVTDTHALPALRRSAMECLAVLEDQPSIETLKQIALDSPTPTPLRVAAATAAGKIAEDGLAADADSLAQTEDAVGRLLAVRLLANQSGQPALRLAEQLAPEGDAVVSAEALAIVLRLDPQRVIAMQGRVITDGRPKVRLQIAKAYATQSTDQAIAALIRTLDDPSVVVRSFGRDALAAIAAETARREAVGRAAEEAVADPAGWRQAEQAALLIGLMDYKPAHRALLGRMDHPRAEVRLAVAEALRRIQAEAALPAMLKRAEALTQRWQAAAKAKPPDIEAMQHAGDEVTQLFQTFGVMRYAAADPLLRRYIKKSDIFSSRSRSAAIYALGLIHEGQDPGGISGKLAGRVRDITGMVPDADDVRRFSIITIGRLNAKNQVALLKKFAETEATTEIGAACRWSLERITGKAPPAPEPERRPSRGWYLEPIGG